MKRLSSATHRTLVGLLLAVAAATASSGAATLWSIGARDTNTAEFALGPKDYQAYRQPGVFIVGESDPRKDWPYVQPGVADGWGPGTPQTFEIFFAIESAPAEPCRLELDFADTHSSNPPKLRVEVNDLAREFQTPAGAGDASVFGEPAKGRPYVISLDVPAATLKAGENRVAITTLTGSWVLWDAVQFEAPAGVKLSTLKDRTLVTGIAASRTCLVWQDGKPAHLVTLDVRRVGEPVEATVRVGTQPPLKVMLRPGTQTVEAFSPPAAMAETVPVTLAVGGQVVARKDVELEPVRQWAVYILMHSHVDIGYTDIQPHIAAKQAHNVTRALELIPKTKDYPDDARFRWNLEVHWTYEQFWTNATPEQKQAFQQAVHDGYIGLDAMYGNLLTGISRGEELVHQLAFAKELGARCGVNVDSMMISDVPGLTWGLIPALTQAGVKYISDGPNFTDRIGWTRVTWEDKPFYWIAPNGKDKVLYWAPYFGYAFGHTVDKLTDAVQRDLQQLEEKGYPYDLVQIRWSKGDNGSADERVMQQVRDWNAKYASPRLIIATTSRMFHDFEQRYADKIPSFRGDFTPYWEDGAPTSARETSLNRHSADRLSQAETLWALLNPAGFPAAEFAEAWKDAALYSEHTWGAYNSVSQPDLDFVKTQWKFKQAYALGADALSRSLLDRITRTGAAQGASASPAGATTLEYDVFNTASWPRTDLVTLPKETQGDVVKEAGGQTVPSQRLSSGELVFLARDVPPLGAKRYQVLAGTAASAGSARAQGATLTTERFTVKLDEATGDIVSLRQQGLDAELVDGKLNEYLYLPGSDAKDVKPSGPGKITVKESGPLVASLLVESEAPSCRQLLREVRVVDGLDRVELIDEVDKLPLRKPEGLHFGFEFNVPGAVVRMNSPLAVVEPEKDQLPGACKNWFSIERWVDVANARYGVTWATVDAPMVEMGGLTANLVLSQPNPAAYMKTIKPSSKLYSWVMNNHWHTNYRADQEGKTTFRYAIRPHHGYDPIAAAHFGVEATEPLIAAPASGASAPLPPLRVEPNGVVLTAFKPSEDGKAWILRLYGASGQDQIARLVWTKPVSVSYSDVVELPGQPAPERIPVPAWSLVTLRAELP
ncbi:MAG: polysaccharide lyase family protein [Limisphaerales bacterium]